MKVYVHIGSPKTATTSILKALRSHRGVLLSKNGLYVPESFLNSSNNSIWLLNVAALEFDRFSPKKLLEPQYHSEQAIRQLREEVKAEISNHIAKAELVGATRCIFSNEGLYFLKYASELERLKSFFDPYNVEIIMAHRDQASFQKSWKKQLQKMQMPESEDSNSFAYVREDSYLFQYGEKIRQLEEIFGKSRVHVLPYVKGEMVAKFMACIGIKDGQSLERYENVTPL